MLTVLGGISEFERALIMSRTGDGSARAKARGVKFGRKPKLSAEQRNEVRDPPQCGETASRDCGRATPCIQLRSDAAVSNVATSLRRLRPRSLAGVFSFAQLAAGARGPALALPPRRGAQCSASYGRLP